MVLGFLKKEKKQRLFISLDIGTELLKGILFSESDLGITALKHSYLRQPTKAMRSGVILDRDLVIHGSASVLENLLKDQKLKGYDAILGIAGELINGISVKVEYTRDKANKVISEAEEVAILEYVYNSIAVKGLSELAQRLGTDQNNVTVLHIGVVGLSIDDKPQVKLQGQKGRNVRIFVYASFAPLDYINTLESIMKQVGINPAGIVAQPYAVARAFKGSRDVGFNGIFVDIGGGTTDVAVIRKGFSLRTKMYAFGGRLFTNSIAKKLGVSQSLAEEYKIKYSSGQLPVDTALKVRSALSEDVKLWVDSFKTALEDFVEDGQLPSSIHLCGGGAMLPDLIDAIRNYSWTQNLPFIKHPNVSLISPENLERVFLQDAELTRPYDVTPISLGRVYYDVLSNPKYNYLNKVFKK